MKESTSSKLKELMRFKEIKIYSDTEWILDNRKKYRQVFDRVETSYVYVEISLYNKRFDKENWDIELELRCVKSGNRQKPICKLPLNKRISKYDSIAYIREGWGNKKRGAFWKEGKYQWQLFIGDRKIGTKDFYIIDNKSPFKVEKYIEIDKIGFFEGSYEDVNSKNKKKYLQTLSQSHTKYIFCNLFFSSKLNKNWVGEFFIKFYNNQGDLKTSINRLVEIKKEENQKEVVAGFGSNTKGSWLKGKYRVEIVFMNTLVATTHFTIGDEFIEGYPKIKLNYQNDRLLADAIFDVNETFETTFKKLDNLIGLREIKNKVLDHAQYLKFLQLRKKKGFEENTGININSVFTGNPGTGKTTVARLMGEIYKQMGLLSKGHVHEVDRVDLIGEFIGQTAPKVKEAIEKAKGGILFIDEAYSLARSQDDNKDFGREAIEILIKEMSSSRKDLAVIVAGYPKQMNQFIDSNPGLKSRFKHYFNFLDYLPEELMEIALLACKEKEITLDDKAKAIINEIIIDAFRDRDEAFGNARYVYDIIEKAKINLGIRIMKRKNPDRLSTSDLKTIKPKDVIPLSKEDVVVLPDLPVDEDLLNKTLKELNSLVGITNIKTQINEMIDVVRYHKASGKNVLSTFYLHTVLIGNPGTGKTSVARIITKIYKALGILERGHLVETDRQGLIAGFVGQTAIKTSEKIDEAMGGVLFIDEAYALSNFNGLQGDFGNEAIQTILKKMEDDRGKFFLFVAGYPDNMDRFLKANPGLSSRFDKHLTFEDYSSKELLSIGISMLKEQKYRLDKDARAHFKNALQVLVDQKDKYFGNARVVRQIVSDIIIHQNLRVAGLPSDSLSNAELNLIKVPDVIHALKNEKEKTIQKRQIGY